MTSPYGDTPQAKQANPYGDTPLPEGYGQPVVKDGQFQIGGEINALTEGVAGAVEPAMAMGSGMVAGTVAPIGGAIQQLLNPNNPAAGFRSRDRIQEALTYQPRTERGQAVIGGIGETMEPVAEAMEATRLGDEALEAGLPEWLAKNAEAIPEYIMAAVSGLGLLPKTQSAARTATRTQKPVAIGKTDQYGNIVPGMDKNAILRDQLRRETGQGATAGFELKGGELAKSAVGKNALGQGWDQVSVAGVKASTPATKVKIKRMIDVAKERLPERATAKARIELRPSDIAGKSLMERYQFIQKANESSGKLLNKIAKDQKGVVNISEPLQWLKNQLSEQGIELMPNGKIDFSNARVLATDHGLIRENIKQLQIRLKQPMTFHNAHTLKQTMRRSGLSYKETAMKKGATPEVQAMFKGFSGKIDGILDGKSTAYDAQNVKWAKTNEALDAVKQIAKDNLFKESPESNLGVLTKRMMGNPVSRQAVINYSKKLDDVAREYGGKFDDDLFLQAYVANDMDKVIEVAAQTSLKGEAGAQAFAQQIDKSAVGKLAHGIDTVAKVIGHRSELKALDTLQALTK